MPRSIFAASLAAIVALLPLPLRAQVTSPGPRRAAISAQTTTSPGSASRGGISISSAPRGTGIGQDSSTMSAPAFPRLTNVGSGSAFGTTNSSAASSQPTLFGRPSAAAPASDPGYLSAESRFGMERSTRTNYQPGVLRVVKGSGTLPSDGGQIWREYDISPYTSRAKNQDKPEQAVIDWILRETGTDVWFSEPLGILSAGRKTLRV